MSNLAGYTVGLLISFFLNKYYVYRNYSDKKNTYIQFIKFLVIFLIAYIGNIFILYISLQHVNSYFAQFIAMLMYTIVSFALNKIFTFKEINEAV